MKEYILMLALTHNVQPAVLESLLRVESSYCEHIVHVNRNKTVDVGCLQVNSRNLNVFEYHRAIHDSEYGIQQGIKILKQLKRQYPTEYVGRYNVGVGLLDGKRLKLYNEYVDKMNPKYNKYFKGVTNEIPTINAEL